MRISVLVHNFNRASALKTCLDSVAIQTFRPIEVIILDAGSTDSSLEVIKHACHVMDLNGIEARCVICKPMGVASSRNFGARECGGDLICAVDNDACFADSESLVRVVELFRSDARLGVLSFCILREDTEEIDPFTWVYRRSQRKWAKKEFKTFTFTGGGFCVRAKAFWEVGGFWDHLEFSREEEDLAFGLINRGWEVVYTPEIVIRHYPENRRSHKIAERRVNEFRNGILILWRRLPIPFSLFAVCLRVCTMSVKAFLREKRFPTTLLYVLPEVIREWNKSGLKRTPIRFASVWRYVVLHMRS